MVLCERARRRAPRRRPTPCPRDGRRGHGGRRSPPAGCTGPGGRSEQLGARECLLAPADVEAVPAAPVLVQEQHRRARRPSAGAQSRRLELEERHQAEDLWLFRRQGGEHPGESERFGAEPGPQPVVPGGGGVSLVEDEVDHLQHRTEAGGPVRAMRDLERVRLPLRSSAWRGRCAAQWWAPAPRRRGRSREPSSRRPGATSAPSVPGTGSTGWQETNIRRRRSSSISCFDSESKSISSSDGSETAISSSRPSRAYFSLSVRSRRKRSTALRFPTVVSQAPGFSGVPSRGHWRKRVDQRVLCEVFRQSDVADEGRQGGDHPRKLQPEDRLDAGGRIGGWHATDSTIRHRRDLSVIR